MKGLRLAFCARGRGACGLSLPQAGQPGAPEGASVAAGQGDKLGPVLGVRVFRAAIGVMGGRRVKQVKVDAVHGFRPD